MFKQAIEGTLLTTETANSFFRHIRGSSFKGDASFLSTVRALVAPRMKENERLYIRFHGTDYSSNVLDNYSTERIINSIFDPKELENDRSHIVIHNFYNSHSDNLAFMEFMRSNFTQMHTDWHILEKVTDFYRKTFDVLCFINPQKKNVFICTDNMDMRKMHYLQCSILAFLPWYFDPEAGVSDLEMELIESLRGKDASVYEDCIARIAERYDFRTAKIRQLLSGFESKYEKKERDRTATDVQDCIDRIESYNREIGRILNRKHDLETRLLGLETKIANESEESEIMDYFLHSDNLILENADDSTIVFTVKTYLEYFDEELAQRVIENNRSYIYRPGGRTCDSIIPEEDMRKLMTAVFIDQILKIKFCASYRFEICGNVSALQYQNFGAECRGCIPNPHINGYGCLGSYNTAINELLERNDYISAIEQCAASCKSLNFSDSTVMHEFMKQLYGISDRQGSINIRCIELPDGSVATPTEAIKWIKSQQEAQTNE